MMLVTREKVPRVANRDWLAKLSDTKFSNCPATYTRNAKTQHGDRMYAVGFPAYCCNSRTWASLQNGGSVCGARLS